MPVGLTDAQDDASHLVGRRVGKRQVIKARPSHLGVEAGRRSSGHLMTGRDGSAQLRTARVRPTR